MSSALREQTDASPDGARALPRPGWLRSPRLPAYAAIAIAVLVRAAPVLSADFPLNDGGFFYRMTEELEAAHYRLPSVTTYNNTGIPFAYSPLGFYLAAALHGLAGIPLLQLFRFIPLVATALTVVAFHRLARAMLRDERAAAAAVLAFGILPRSFVWLVMGGGLTRAIGFLFAIVALHQSYLLYTRRRWRYAATTAVACALTVLSHLSTASFLAFSIALFFVFYGRHRHGVLASAVVAAATVLLTAPWWATVIAEHGLAPFRAAQSVSGSIFGDSVARYDVVWRLARFNYDIAGEGLFPLIGVLAVVGSLASLRPGRFVLPVWWALTTALDARGGMTYASIPASLLAGIGIADVLVPGLRRLYGADRPHRREPGVPHAPAPHAPAPHAPATPADGVAALLQFVPTLVLAGLLAYGVGKSLSRNPDLGGEVSSLTALTPDDLEAMTWATLHTPPTSRFLIVTGKSWARDKVAEWFPALTSRTSVSTIQGSEWLPGFVRRLRENDDGVQAACPRADGRCLAAWAGTTGHWFTHVYVAKTAPANSACCGQLIAALRRDSSYVPLYDGPAAFIAQRRANDAAARPSPPR